MNQYKCWNRNAIKFSYTLHFNKPTHEMQGQSTWKGIEELNLT